MRRDRQRHDVVDELEVSRVPIARRESMTFPAHEPCDLSPVRGAVRVAEVVCEASFGFRFPQALGMADGARVGDLGSEPFLAPVAEPGLRHARGQRVMVNPICLQCAIERMYRASFPPSLGDAISKNTFPSFSTTSGSRASLAGFLLAVCCIASPSIARE